MKHFGQGSFTHMSSAGQRRWLVLLLMATTASVAGLAAAKTPNVILIVTDDQGYGVKNVARLRSNNRVVAQFSRPLRSLRQARKSQRMASKSAANGSDKRVTCHPTTASIFWPATGHIFLTRRVTKMTPHVLILPISSPNKC